MPKGSRHTPEARARMSAALMGHPAYNWKHGMFGTPEHRAYFSAQHRCTNQNNPHWKEYGGRGIKFLFTDFNQFFATVGLRPSNKHSLDRINNDGHYEPGNIRWATNKEQWSNRKVKTLRNFSDEELLTEAKRRGLIKS